MRKSFLITSLFLGLYQLTTAQNVGIGTTTPNAQLHIKYNTASTGISNPVLILDNPAGGAHTSMQFQVDGIETGRIRSSLTGTLSYSTSGNANHIFRKGNDGTDLLIIDGTTSSLVVNAGNDNNGDISGALIFGHTGSGEGIASKRTSGGNQFGLDFYTSSNPRMSIALNGNIGVGTTAPSELLDVAGKIKATTIQLTNGAGNGYLLQTDAIGNASWVSPSSVNFGQWSTTGNHIYNSNSGNVGIGTNNPTELLNLRKDGFDNYLKIEAGGTNANYSGLMLTESSFNYGWSIRHSAATDDLYIDNQDNTPTFTNVVTFKRNGNVGIGITSPTRQLTVAGDMVVDANGSNNGDIQTSSFTFGGSNSGEGFASKRNAGGNQFGLDFYTGYVNRMAITSAGKVGIGTSSPSSLLHASGGNFLVSGSFGSGSAIEAGGPGTRMFFNPSKAAFRAGEADNDQWNDVNVGNYSVALGYSGKASGEKSFAAGNFAEASNTNSVAIGNNANAGGTGAIALGNSAEAGGDFSAALGSAAFAGAANSVAAGSNVHAYSYAEVVVGSYNTSYTPNSTTVWDSNDRLFTVGNGSSSGSKSNAMVILKNGNTGIGTSTPASLLHISSTSNTTIITEGTSGNAYFIARATTGNEAGLRFNTGSANRWLFGKTTGTESGSTAGSDFFINRYDDAGSFVGQPFLIKRSTGNIGIGGIGDPQQKIDVAGNINVSSTNGYYIGNSRVLSNTGTDNLFAGVSAGNANSSGSSNTFIGKVAGESNTGGNNNTALGHAALNGMVSGSFNTALGGGAGLFTTGSNNVIVGYGAGPIVGSSNILIGFGAGGAETGSNKMYIDNSSTSSPLIYGDFSKDSIAVNGSFEVGGAFSLKVKTNQVAGTNNPDATGGIWFYSSGSGNITLPAAASNTNRTYVIVNNTGAARNITYRDIANAAQTSMANNTSLWLVSDGTNWRQIK